MKTYTTEEIWRNAPKGATHHSIEGNGNGFFYTIKPARFDAALTWLVSSEGDYYYDNLGFHDLTNRDWRETLTERPI